MRRPLRTPRAPGRFAPCGGVSHALASACRFGRAKQCFALSPFAPSGAQKAEGSGRRWAKAASHAPACACRSGRSKLRFAFSASTLHFFPMTASMRSPFGPGTLVFLPLLSETLKGVREPPSVFGRPAGLQKTKPNPERETVVPANAGTQRLCRRVRCAHASPRSSFTVRTAHPTSTVRGRDPWCRARRGFGEQRSIQPVCEPRSQTRNAAMCRAARPSYTLNA